MASSAALPDAFTPAMDEEDAGMNELVAATTAKDEQIAILKAVLVQLNDELKKKDRRIAELELQIKELTNQDAVTMTNSTPLTCLHCSRGQSSEGIASPMTTRTLSSSSDHLVFTRNLSPIEEVTDGQRGVVRRGGSHGNKTKGDTLDQEQQKVQELQQAIAAIDSAIAELELQATSEQRLKALKRERGQLMVELNCKVQLRLKRVRHNSDEVLSRLATEYENCSREQMCEAVRELDRAQAKYKAYIDQLLAVALETNSALLEGMPRLQQSSGLRMDLLRVASRGELFDDLQERERNVASLESYATLLAKRLMEHAPPLLPSVDSFHDTESMTA